MDGEIWNGLVCHIDFYDHIDRCVEGNSIQLVLSLGQSQSPNLDVRLNAALSSSFADAARTDHFFDDDITGSVDRICTTIQSSVCGHD